jgi:hypothetical protein
MRYTNPCFKNTSFKNFKQVYELFTTQPYINDFKILPVALKEPKKKIKNS